VATLLDYSWAGAAADPVGSPWASTPGEGTFQRIGDGTGGVSTNFTFSIIYDTGHAATANHKSTSYFSDVGGRNGGPAVCLDVLTGACFFIQNGDVSNVRFYWTNGLGSFTEIGVAVGYSFNTTDGWTLERVSAGNILRAYQGGVQIGSDVVDSSLSGGEPATTGYDAAQRWSRIVHEDDSAGPSFAGDDDSGDWWAGVQRCATGVAIAGASAALSIAVGIANSNFKSEDLPVASGATALYEGDPPQLRTAIASPTYVVWAADEEIVPQPAVLDDDPWVQPRPQVPSPVTYQAWTDGEVPTFTKALDDGVWWRAQWVEPAQGRQPWFHDDVVLQPSAIDSDTWGAWLSMPWASVAASQPPAVCDDIAPPPVAPIVDDDAWQRIDAWQAAPALWVARVDDDLPLQVSSTLVEDYWPLTPIARAAAVAWLPPPDDDAPIIALSDDYWPVPALAPAGVVVWLPLADDFVPLPLGIAEDYWLQPPAAAVDPVVRVATEQDEIATPPPPLGVDELYWPVPPAPTVPPTFRPWGEGDEWVPYVEPPAPTPAPTPAPPAGGGGGSSKTGKRTSAWTVEDEDNLRRQLRLRQDDEEVLLAIMALVASGRLN